MTSQELKEYLDFKADQYNHPDFITSDPIQIPHQFSLKEDIEISGFLTATIAWGNRKSIITNALKLMEIFGQSPYDFVMNYQRGNSLIENFVHRTFNGIDLDCFLLSLKNIYNHHQGLEAVFKTNENRLQHQISVLKNQFFLQNAPSRSFKHFSDPSKGSAAKRINMFLRWMCRKDSKGVDFGLWKSISPHQLSCPLDVHSGSVARGLGILNRKQNDAKALEELDETLRVFDATDPSKYDFALFGIGVFEKKLNK